MDKERNGARREGLGVGASVLLTFLLTGCIVNLNLLPTVEPLEEKTIGGAGKDKIVLLEISGIISEEDRDTGFGTEPNLVARIKEELRMAARDPSVKAVVLRINSPGGTVTASDVVYHELLRFKQQTGKKVIASIMDLGASGGYYVALAADRIIVHPTTVTGSIGVIMLNFNVEGLLEKIGVAGTAIKSGEKKDMGSPLRPMAPEELRLFQTVIDQMYERFLEVVSAGRENLSPAEVKRAADGRIYTAHQALDLGLVDQIGYLEDAFELAGKEAGMAQARIVIYARPGKFKDNIYSRAPGPGPATVNFINLDLRTLVQPGVPRFMYLWLP